MNKRNMKKKRRGFSLVELIVVIGIMGVLAMVAVPKYSAYQKKADRKADLASAKVIADATVYYLNDNEIDTFGPAIISDDTVASDNVNKDKYGEGDKLEELLTVIPSPKVNEGAFYVIISDEKPTVYYYNDTDGIGDKIYPQSN